MAMREAFVTGSRAYGTPRDNSDIDLVIHVSKEDAAILWALSDGPTCLRFGRLNLILTTVDSDHGTKQYDNWRFVTDQLKKIAPVTREVAIAKFMEVGIGKDYHSVAGPEPLMIADSAPKPNVDV